MQRLGRLIRSRSHRSRIQRYGRRERTQPLALTDRNEIQAEFYARLTYADHRWSDPWLGFRGHETDIGSVYVAYGPPDLWMVFDRQAIVWVYRPSRFRFQFALTPGYTRARS